MNNTFCLNQVTVLSLAVTMTDYILRSAVTVFRLHAVCDLIMTKKKGKHFVSMVLIFQEGQYFVVIVTSVCFKSS